MGTNTDIGTNLTPHQTWKGMRTLGGREADWDGQGRNQLWGLARANAEGLATWRMERRLESKGGRKTEEMWGLDKCANSSMWIWESWGSQSCGFSHWSLAVSCKFYWQIHQNEQLWVASLLLLIDVSRRMGAHNWESIPLAGWANGWNQYCSIHDSSEIEQKHPAVL